MREKVIVEDNNSVDIIYRVNQKKLEDFKISGKLLIYQNI